MQLFYNNKSKNLNFLLKIDNSPLTDVTAKFIIKVNNNIINFAANIDELGNCSVTIPPLYSYNVLGIGTLQLEVAQNNLIYYPFSDEIIVQNPAGLDFSQFATDINYDSQDLLSSPTWRNKHVYNSSPYLVLPDLKFNIAIGDTKPDLKFFVFKLGEKFGDPIPLSNLASYTITIKIYDYNANLIAFGPASSIDVSSGEITYTFNPFDFIQSGIYFFEVEFKGTNGDVFTLPESNIKNEIIVRD